ncbi:MAG: hypothetical protein WBU92_08535 [Candidatus Dormiibacterota bacterium]
MPGPSEWELALLPAVCEHDRQLADDSLFDLVPSPPLQARLVPILSRRGVTLGPALTRRPGVVEAITGIPGVGEVRLSPIGGTVGPGGPSWLAVLFAARIREGTPRPLDAVLEVVRGWLEARFSPLRLDRGRVEGAWCPGFSDLSVGGRKLVGVGFKLRRDAVLARAVVQLRPLREEELGVLDLCHRAFGPGVDGEVLTSLGEQLAQPQITRRRALLILGAAGARTEKIPG